jgi:hypothetical protein
MSSRRRWWRQPAVWIPSGLVAVALVVVAMAAFQPWKLFVDVTVNEALPDVGITETPSEPTSGEATDSTEDAAAPADSSAAPEETAPEAAEPERVIEAEGAFISHEHSTSGTARVITLPDGSRILRLADLDTDNGPDLKVWLAAAPVIEGTEGWYVFDDDEYVDLGPLKGNKGNQNYAIPADVDISDLSSVTIWCDRFSVSFGAAELTPA